MKVFIHILLLFSIVFSSKAALVTQSYGYPDDFVDNEFEREYVPRSAELTKCTKFNWENVNGYRGDKKPMNQPWFDKTGTESALAWTVSNIPLNIVNPRIVLKFKGTGDKGYNDGFGFFWDENIPSKGGECRARFFKTFTSIDEFKSYDKNKIFEMTFYLGDIKLYKSDTKVVDKIKDSGYFHFFVGDDTTVDYFRFIYESEYDVDEIVSFTCKEVESGTRSLSEGEKCYTDSELTISTVLDSFERPFAGSLMIKTYLDDKTSLDSSFKVKISNPTRFWVFVAETDLAANVWITNAGYQRLDGNIILSDGTKFIPFSKRYDGGRWVVFGAPSIEASLSSMMYFVGFAPASTQITVKSNPSASCDCESTGDPHFVTWDNRKFDFFEEGAFHMIKARDCSFDVQAYNFKYGPKVTLNGIVGVRYLGDVITLSRNPEKPGQLWTGHPVCRVNGKEVTESTEIGELKVIRETRDKWRIELPIYGLVVRGVSAGKPFHIYTSLSDPDYQKRVDGLCGNCDSNKYNDFKFPNCENAIDSRSSSLEWRETIQWGTSWKVSSGQLFANHSLLEQEGLGTLNYDSCTTNPIRQYCSDLVPPEYQDDGEPIVESLPPSDFFACDGDRVIKIVDEEPPDVVIPDDLPPTSCDELTYPKIVEKCQQCAQLNHYDPEDCVTDLCESGEEVDEYECPGDNKCVQAKVPEVTVTLGTYEWALLDGSDIEGIPEEEFCDTVHYLPPSGWEVSPVTDDAKEVISQHPWSTLCVAIGDTSFQSSSCDNQEGSCPTKGTVVKTTNGCYISNTCNTKILIRKPLQPECGNGILERDEKCDDGNTDEDDGCSSTCTVDEGYVCISTMTPNLCSSVSNVVEEESHECPIQVEGCRGCAKTDENRDDDFCCSCELPCCD